MVENKMKYDNYAMVRGGCQMLCAGGVPKSCGVGILLTGLIPVWGKCMQNSAGMVSAVMGKKEKTSPVDLKGSFMSRS